jgi:putative ABC transport system permease protein
MLWNNVKLAFRTLRRRTGYALTNGVGFTIGLVCCVLVLLFIRHELRYDHFHEDEEDVHRVLRDKRGNWWSTIPFPDYENATAEEQRRLPRALAEQIPAIETATNFYVGPHGEESPAFIERGDRQFTEAQLLYTTTGPSFFNVFPFEFLRGTRDQALRAPGTAVLTASAAARYFGRTDVVGEQLTVRRQQGARTVEVTGVIEDVPSHSHFTFEVALHVDRIQNWGAYTYFRLKPDAEKPEGLATRIEGLMDEVRPQRVDDPQLRAVLGDVRLQALTDIHLGPRMLYDQKQHRDPRYLWAFGAIGVLILLIVVINYTNLAVALSTERRQDIGVRKALGAGRGRVAMQSMTEAIVLTLLCVPVVLVALKGLIPAFNQVMNTGIQSRLFTAPGILAGLVGVAVLIGGLAGSYPALVLSRKEAVSLFRGSQDTGGPQGWSMRHVLIGVQFALLIGLGSVTWLVNSQLHFLQNKELGFQTQGLVEVPAVDSADTYRRLKQRLRGVPEVQAVGAGIGPGPGRFEVTYRAQDSERIRSDGDVLNVTPGWFEALDIDHPAVQKMQAAGGQGTARLIVNRVAVEALGYETPLGKTVVVEPRAASPDRLTIDGVVDNFHFRPLYQRVQPTFLRVHPRARHMDPLNVRAALVRLDPQALEAGLDRLETAWTSVRPDTPFAPEFVDTQLAQLYEEEQRIGQMSLGLTVIALLLAALGLVGLSAYVVQRRTKEIGVRKALGATVSGIVLRLNREFLVLLGVALVVAAPVAYLVAEQWLATFAYRIGVSPLVFLGAGGVALVASLAAASYQAWTTARIDPAEALQQE